MSDRIDIAFLADHPEAIPQLARWFELDWAPHYGPDGPGDAEADLRNTANHNSLPIAMVAVKDGDVCGTTALKMESVTTPPQFAPWLAALLVGQGHRGQGISHRLINAIVGLDRSQGFHKIYCGTNPEYANVALPGWTFIEKVTYFASDAEIYRMTL